MRWMTSRPRRSRQHAMPVTPADQYVQRPYARPVQTRRAVLERRPQPRHRPAVQTDRRRGTLVAQRVGRLPAQASAHPAVERHHEAALGPIEQRRVQSGKANSAQDLFAAEWMIARRLVESIDRLNQLAID